MTATGLALGVLVGVAVGVPSGVGVAVGSGVGVLVGARTGVAVASGVGVNVGMGVRVATATGVGAWYRTGVRVLELCPEPNLPQGGWGSSWSSVAEFVEWWSQAADVLRRLYPEIRIGWPGLASTWTARSLGGVGEEAFDGAASPGTQLDWVGVRAHWRDEREILAETGGLSPWRARQRWPGHLLIVTGFGPIDALEPEPARARQCARFVDHLQALPGVAAAFTDGSGGSWWAPGGRVSNLAVRLGERAAYSVASS